MQRLTSVRHHAQSLAAALLILSCATAAYGEDTYSRSTRQLTIPRVAISSAIYTNMVVTVGGIVSGPKGSAANGIVDSYEPGNNQLTVQSVNVEGTTYYNVVVTVEGLVSIGSVIGADSYNGTDLEISHIQLGGTTYDGVALAESIGNVVSIAGGMPTFVPDTYDALSNQLAIPAVQVGGRVYTNVVLTAGKVASVAGVYSAVQESIVHSFSGQHGTAGVSGSMDGADPAVGAGLIQDSNGNLYGTTFYGGANDAGTVFMLNAQRAESVLYSFTGNTDGANPAAGLVRDGLGYLYGTTQNGGANGYGSVFRINPDNSETILYSFCPVYPCADGKNPVAGLVLASDDNLYGVAAGGGAKDTGTVFRISPTGSFSLLYTFLNNQADAAAPGASLIQASDHNLYGTSAAGGAYGDGALYRVTLAGDETVIYSFCAGGASGNGCTDGAAPNAGLIQGTDGNLYGMTSSGGAYHSGGNTGTVFRITTAGVMTILHSFCGDQTYSPCVDAGFPVGALIQANDGNFYGATRNGGANNFGAIFKLTPTGVETLSFSFQGDTNTNTSGLDPGSGVIQASDGSFYGITSPGGTYSEGTIYHVTNLVALQ
jgi:uncharacterized repeat protein (TIGR03803 family)